MLVSHTDDLISHPHTMGLLPDTQNWYLIGTTDNFIRVWHTNYYYRTWKTHPYDIRAPSSLIRTNSYHITTLYLSRIDDLLTHPYDIATNVISYERLPIPSYDISCNAIVYGLLIVTHPYDIGIAMICYTDDLISIPVSYGGVDKSSIWAETTKIVSDIR